LPSKDKNNGISRAHNSSKKQHQSGTDKLFRYKNFQPFSKSVAWSNARNLIVSRKPHNGNGKTGDEYKDCRGNEPFLYHFVTAYTLCQYSAD